MTDRPILFSAPMILALLAGRKTQTRRLIKINPTGPILDFVKVATDNETGRSVYEMKGNGGSTVCIPAGKDLQTPHFMPPIAVGDRLWVRESLSVDYEEGDSYDPMGGVRESACGVSYGFARGPSVPYHVYAADREYLEYPDGTAEPPMRGIPSIHMPKWASRITLTVTDVKVERLHDISEADAIAEGASQYSSSTKLSRPFNPDWKGIYREGYAELWNEINGAGAWEDDPWIIAYTFSVHLGNIDQIGRAA